MQKYLSKLFHKTEKIGKESSPEIQKKFKMSTAFLWILSCLSFLALLFWGKISVGENQEVVYFREYLPLLLEKGKDSTLLVFFSLSLTVVLSIFFTSFSFFYSWLEKKISIFKTHRRFSKPFFFSFLGILKIFVMLPNFLSSIPLFITGIFLIRIFHLDTVNEKNLFYGVLCLSLFNLSYITRRTVQKIALAYQAPYVLYAHSLGLPEFTIFRHYIMPTIIKDHFTILRELLPHLTIESVIIEYTFGYSALIRSLINAILYQSWAYFILIFLSILLFLTFFNIFFQFIEDMFF